MLDWLWTTISTNPLAPLLIILYMFGGWLLYWQVLQLNLKADKLIWWRIALYTIISGPIVWILWVLAYINHRRRQPHESKFYAFKLRMLNWLKGE